MFFFELMHLADCKGVSSIAFGSAIQMLLRKNALGCTMGDRLKTINTYMKEWYATRPRYHRLPPIRPSNLKDSENWANLCGPSVKAATTRAFAPLMRDLGQMYFTADTAGDRCVKEVLDSLAIYYDTLYAAPMFVPPETVASLRATCVRMGENWQMLRHQAMMESKLWWKVSPKVHKLQHTPLWCEVLNVRYVQVYAEESTVGTTAKVWKRCVSGQYQCSAQSMVLMKRTLGLLLRFETEEDTQP